MLGKLNCMNNLYIFPSPNVRFDMSQNLEKYREDTSSNVIETKCFGRIIHPTFRQVLCDVTTQTFPWMEQKSPSSEKMQGFMKCSKNPGPLFSLSVDDSILSMYYVPSIVWMHFLNILCPVQ